ncbi:MAG: IS3 family transposase [Endomicrobium sp.]|nr:IS3 family transposase [Endomicrobium sp.]
MKEITQEKQRYGSPKIYILLKREGFSINHKKAEPDI